MARIELRNVTVRYPVYTTSRQRSLLGYAANRATLGRVARDAGSIPIVVALQNISLSLEDGDRLAVIGRNGSGKTTLLKLVSGLLLPDLGGIVLEGKRTSLISGGAGFDPDKSGLENTDMIGRLMGLSRKEREQLKKDVSEFTELGEFLNLPFRTYSTGMGVRLSFAIATSIVPELLIMDEILGAGDAIFIEKARRRVNEMVKGARLLVLATHSGETAIQFCNKCIWLHQGRIVAQGDPRQVWDLYMRHGEAASPERIAAE